MSDDQFLKDQGFKLYSDVRADSKKRISLPAALKETAALYKVYANDAGQIVLDPQVLVPASEAWLFENKKALGALRKGLKDAAAGKLVRRKSQAKHAKDPIE